jgi:hypothetical protein
MGDVNLNIFNFNSFGFQPTALDGLNRAAFSDVNDILSDIFSDLAQLFDSGGSQNFNGIAPGGCVSEPRSCDRTHPEGSLQTDGNVVTTPGGYKIEATGQYEWTITGPDGKTDRIWGDPHVVEGDGGKWDFKRNSTFVLGDGTRINVSTTPHGDNGATVTTGLEIINGNDRVDISGIDKGKGVVGQVTQDGYAHANDFGGNDVFVMGDETDDWSFQGREITGSNNGGDSFQLGDDLAAGDTNALWAGNDSDWMQLIHNFLREMMGNWNDNWRPNPYGSNGPCDRSADPSDGESWYDRGRHQDELRQAFRSLGRMFNLLARLASLDDRMHVMRNRAVYA